MDFRDAENLMPSFLYPLDFLNNFYPSKAGFVPTEKQKQFYLFIYDFLNCALVKKSRRELESLVGVVWQMWTCAIKLLLCYKLQFCKSC